MKCKHGVEVYRLRSQCSCLMFQSRTTLRASPARARPPSCVSLTVTSKCSPSAVCPPAAPPVAWSVQFSVIKKSLSFDLFKGCDLLSAGHSPLRPALPLHESPGLPSLHRDQAQQRLLPDGLQQQVQPPHRSDGQPGPGGGVWPIRTQERRPQPIRSQNRLEPVPGGQPGRERPRGGRHDR